MTLAYVMNKLEGGSPSAIRAQHLDPRSRLPLVGPSRFIDVSSLEHTRAEARPQSAVAG